MNAYLTLIKIDIRLAFRQRIVIFFELPDAAGLLLRLRPTFQQPSGGAILQVVTMVIVIGILGNGLFGAGIRAAQERETTFCAATK